MRTLWQEHPDDPDIGAFFAEAMMDLRPWDQWTPEGQPQPGTERILATLDAVLKLNLNHPFANHLYIRAVEASPHPERANGPADRLRTLQPGIAHNVHMPSHIDIRCGRWHEAITANLNAIEADRRYRAIAGPPTGFLPLYVAHNEIRSFWVPAWLSELVSWEKIGEDYRRAKELLALGDKSNLKTWVQATVAEPWVEEQRPAIRGVELLGRAEEYDAEVRRRGAYRGALLGSVHRYPG